MKSRLITLFIVISPVVLWGQGDSVNPHGIYLGMQFVNTPMIQFLQEEENESNFASGLLVFLNFDNVITLKAGGNYHFKKYSVFVDKVYDPDLLTIFHYVDLSVALDGYLIKKSKQQGYISLGISFGKPIYEKGEKREYPVDYLNNGNMSYKMGMGYRASISKRDKLFLEFEPAIMWFVKPVNYRDYSYVKTVDGNHSRSSLHFILTLTYNLTKF